MKKRVSLLFVSILLCLGVLGCTTTEIKPDSKADGTYSTQNPMSSLEYSIFINKQITVFANQLSTRLTMAHNSKDSPYENEADLAKESGKILEDTLEEVIVTQSADTSEDDRESVIEAMQTAVDHMNAYAEDVQSGADVEGYVDAFQNDFNALTGLASLYYQ